MQNDESNPSTILFDLTPDPKVLIALSQTSLTPIQAICELIDNSIDSFSTAKLQGVELQSRNIWIQLPNPKEVKNGYGVLSFRDSGPGMTPEQAEKAIRAGYSSNNAFDNLGLFGLGFNIASSKFGRRTKIITKRMGDEYCTSVTIDLEQISKSRSYQVEALREKSSPEFEYGTMIEIDRWWPNGNQNHDFINKLLKLNLRKELGRIYATLLRQDNVRIMVNGKPCSAFEHCVWGESRYVERRGKKIYAYHAINYQTKNTKRCNNCRSVIPENQTECPFCKSTEIRSVVEKIYGWVGIQRYDSKTEFGIDLIRNGRCICKLEKNAFFTFTDDQNKEIFDYPIDGPYGRIIGEIHLDHVPVDFLKQNFIRTSTEWNDAIEYLRGKSSLQPNNPNADQNHSIIFELYQAYRRVRTPGFTDMYMGYWDEAKNEPKRIDRATEDEYKKRFENREPGYYDDAKWWELVEKASKPPTKPIIECPQCHNQINDGDEACMICGHIIHGKNCISCGEKIVNSAVLCPYCGQNQKPEVQHPWRCEICGKSNPPHTEKCQHCSSPKGMENPLDREALLKISNKDDVHSISDLSITLSDGSESSNVSLTTYLVSKQMLSFVSDLRLPVRSFKNTGRIDVFIDPMHPMITNYSITVEELVATEVATFIMDYNNTLSGRPEHSSSTIIWQIINKYWKDEAGINTEIITKKCEDLISNISEKLASSFGQGESLALFGLLTKDQAEGLLRHLIREGLLDQFESLKMNGGFIRFTPPEFVLTIYDAYPDYFFNGIVWNIPYHDKEDDTDHGIWESLYEETRIDYRNCLEAIILFLKRPTNDGTFLKKTDMTIRHLEEKLEKN